VQVEPARERGDGWTMAAPEPGEQVAGARDVGDARRDVAQHAVARAVAERVVDQLEVVQVQVEQGDLLALAARAGQLAA
jgi:hypothetical protein